MAVDTRSTGDWRRRGPGYRRFMAWGCADGSAARATADTGQLRWRRRSPTRRTVDRRLMRRGNPWPPLHSSGRRHRTPSRRVSPSSGRSANTKTAVEPSGQSTVLVFLNVDGLRDAKVRDQRHARQNRVAGPAGGTAVAPTRRAVDGRRGGHTGQSDSTGRRVTRPRELRREHAAVAGKPYKWPR